MDKVFKNISELHEWEHNPRSISKEGFERLKKQITKLGQYKPLLITADGTVLGGNMRLKAYRELNMDKVWVSVVDAPTEEKKIEYALSDNDRVGKYEGDQLADLIGNFPEVEWNDYAVDIKEPQLVSDIMDQYSEVVEDEVPEVPKVAESKLGEVYTLGRHRLMCGDATKIEDVNKLMDGKKADMVFTDPPYGIDVVGKNGMIGSPQLAKGNKYSPIIGDNKDFDPIFLLDRADKIIIFGGNCFANKLPNNYGWLVWDKREGVDRNNFADCELMWTNLEIPPRIYRCLWQGMIKEGEKGNRVHPTQKPIKLLSEIIKDFTNENDLIEDLFGGSGSTLIACEQSNRTCYMMEIDPLYVDVIRKRYTNYIQNNTKQ